MEFESPDVEREFPGLYASESAKRSNESDFSDESHERISKKDLLIGKRKDKKDKKDRGYATLEGESSPEEESEVKSPSKVKKSKPFKFPSKKEKREKSRDKDNKDKESDKDKKKDDKDKEKKKESKIKLKSKDKKKEKDKKHSEEVIETAEDLPIFGVPLSVAVERSKCHDGVDIPLIIRNCIDHVQETGLMAENVYKVSGIKSRVQQVRKMYNSHEPVCLADFDLPVATSLLKQFLRELPEPVLTTELVGRFEEAGAMKEVSARGARLRELVELLPSCNRVLLGWLIKHFDALAAHEKYNKMNAQTISVTISPLLQISQRLLTALLCHVTELYPHLELVKYVPPLSSTSPVLPDTTEGLALELFKQESLLSQIHREMNQGLIGKDREEQLWGVQRIITQLKRKLRALERSSGQRSLDDTDCSLRLEETSFQKKNSGEVAAGDCSSKPTVVEEERNMEGPSASSLEPSCSGGSRKGSGELSPWIPMEETVGSSGGRRDTLEDVAAFTPPSHSPREETPSPPALVRSVITAESLEVQDINREATEKAEKKQRALLETEELMAEIARLRTAMEEERNTVEKIRGKIHALGGMPYTWSSLSDSSDDDVIPPSTLEQNGLWKRKIELKEESKRLQAKKRGLIESISNESDACIDLRVQIKLLQMGKTC